MVKKSACLWSLLLTLALIVTGEESDLCSSSSFPCTAGCWDASHVLLGASGTRMCRPVGLGYFSSIFDDNRYPCPPGSSSNNSTTARLCRPCLPGTYSYGATGLCMDCPPGSFAAFSSAEYCDSCDPTHYNGSGSESVHVVTTHGTEIAFCEDPLPESTFAPASRFVSVSPTMSLAPTGVTSRSPSTTLPVRTGSSMPLDPSLQPTQTSGPEAPTSVPSPYQSPDGFGYTAFPASAPDASQSPTFSRRHSAYPSQTLGLDNTNLLYDLSIQYVFVAGVVVIIFFCMIVLVCCCKPAHVASGRQNSATPPPSTRQHDDESVHSTYYDENDALEQDTQSVGTLDEISLLDRSPVYFEQLERATGLAFGLDESELLEAHDHVRAEPDESVAGTSLWNYSVAGATVAAADEDDTSTTQTEAIDNACMLLVQ